MSPSCEKRLRIGFWAVLAFLGIPCAEILAVWGFLDGSSRGSGPLTAAAYVAAFALLVAVFGRWLGRGDRDPLFLRRGALVAAILAGLSWCLRDDPAPVLLYSRAMIPVPSEIEGSRAVLLTYSARGTNAVPAVSQELVQAMGWDDAKAPLKMPDLTRFEKEIEQLWSELLPARQVVEKLDTFPGICELANDTRLDASVALPRFTDWRSLVQGYSAYALLRAQQGKPEEGLRELAKLSSVSRKWLPYSLILVCKMVNIELISREVWTAQRILKSVDVPPDALAALLKAFPPVPAEDVSLRRSAIAETLALTGELEKASGPSSVRRLLVRRGIEKPRWVVCGENLACAFLPFKKNASITFLQLLSAPVIEGDVTGKPFQQKIAKIGPSRRNALGEVLISRIAMPDYAKAGQVCRAAKVRSDLLHLEIARRLGRPADLKDFLNGNAYLFDEAVPCYYSAGPDGVPGNADDVRIGS